MLHVPNTVNYFWRRGRQIYLGQGLKATRDKDDPMFAFVGDVILQYMATQCGISVRHGGLARLTSDKLIWKSLSASLIVIFYVFNDANNTHYTPLNNLTIPHKEFGETQKQVIVA
jgi:hypothetical protein